MATRTISFFRRGLAITQSFQTLGLRSVQQNVDHNILKWRNLSTFRFLSSQAGDRYRKVAEETVGDVTTVEAVYDDLPKDFLKVESNPHKACPLCSRNLRVTYKDVLILQQFINPHGGLLPKRQTGVCQKQQRHLALCLHKAHITGLIPDHKPPKKYGVFKEQNWKPKRKVRYNMY